MDLQGHVILILEVLGEPYCGEMAPPKLLQHHISIHHDLADVHRMIPTVLV